MVDEELLEFEPGRFMVGYLSLLDVLNPKAPRRHGRRQQGQFITDLPSLLGLADNPAELVGYGPIPAALVRDRAAVADWVRMVVEPVTGNFLDYGSVIYRPPAELATYIRVRDRHCRFPGCNTRATVCDIDHNIPALRGRPPPPTAAAYADATTG